MPKRARGSAYQRSGDSRWVASLPTRDPSTGLRRPRTEYAHPNTKEAAETLLARMIYEQEQGLRLQPEKVKLEAFAKKWLEEVLRPSISRRSYVTYELEMRRHILPTLGKLPLKEIEAQHVHDWQMKLQKKGLANDYIGEVKSLLSRCLRQAEAWNMVARNVAASVRVPSAEHQEMKVWDQEQVRSFLSHVALAAPRRHAMYAVCLTLGLRQGEVSGLVWSDLDLTGQRPTLSVNATLKPSESGKGGLVRGTVKTKSSRRTLELPRSLVGLLRLHKAMQQDEKRGWAEYGWSPAQDWVFPTESGKPYWAGNLGVTFHADTKRANEAGCTLPEIRWHDMRHTCASILYGRGVPVAVISKMLGHASVSITLDTYTHIFDQSFKEATDAMDDLLGSVGG